MKFDPSISALPLNRRQSGSDWDFVLFKFEVHFFTSYRQVVDFLGITESEKGLTGYVSSIKLLMWFPFTGHVAKFSESSCHLLAKIPENTFTLEEYWKFVQFHCFIFFES